MAALATAFTESAAARLRRRPARRSRFKQLILARLSISVFDLRSAQRASSFDCSCGCASSGRCLSSATMGNAPSLLALCSTRCSCCSTITSLVHCSFPRRRSSMLFFRRAGLPPAARFVLHLSMSWHVLMYSQHCLAVAEIAADSLPSCYRFRNNSAAVSQLHASVVGQITALSESLPFKYAWTRFRVHFRDLPCSFSTQWRCSFCELHELRAEPKVFVKYYLDECLGVEQPVVCLNCGAPDMAEELASRVIKSLLIPAGAWPTLDIAAHLVATVRVEAGDLDSTPSYVAVRIKGARKLSSNSVNGECILQIPAVLLSSSSSVHSSALWAASTPASPPWAARA